MLKARAAELGRDPAEIEIAPQFSMTIAKTAEEAERRYMESGLVAHRKSLAYTGRDLTKQVVANLVGSPDLILEKIDGLKKIGVDHACALMIPADSMAEFEDQVEWFAKVALYRPDAGLQARHRSPDRARPARSAHEARRRARSGRHERTWRSESELTFTFGVTSSPKICI